jgi:surface protein
MWIANAIGVGSSSSGGRNRVFEFTINTANLSAGSTTDTQFKLPLTTSTGLDCKVSWGDGTSDTITNHLAPEVTHTYPSSGVYTVKITGKLLGWAFNNGGDRLKMLDVKKWSGLNISVSEGFYGCTNLTASATDAPLITGTSLASYFYQCTKFNGAIGNWDISNIISLQVMFLGARAFNQDIGSWNTGNVTRMDGTFYSATDFNQPLNNWDVSSVTRMNSMFYAARDFNQPLNNWDVSSVTNMFWMFNRATAFNQDISNWDINQVTTNNFTDFMKIVTLSTTNYDLLLVGWEANLQALYPSGVGYPYTISINFGGSACSPAVKAGARQSLIDNFGWTITDATP